MSIDDSELSPWGVESDMSDFKSTSEYYDKDRDYINNVYWWCLVLEEFDWSWAVSCFVCTLYISTSPFNVYCQTLDAHENAQRTPQTAIYPRHVDSSIFLGNWVWGRCLRRRKGQFREPHCAFAQHGPDGKPRVLRIVGAPLPVSASVRLTHVAIRGSNLSGVARAFDSQIQASLSPTSRVRSTGNAAYLGYKVDDDPERVKLFAVILSLVWIVRESGGNWWYGTQDRTSKLRAFVAPTPAQHSCDDLAPFSLYPGTGGTVKIDSAEVLSDNFAAENLAPPFNGTDTATAVQVAAASSVAAGNGSPLAPTLFTQPLSIGIYCIDKWSTKVSTLLTASTFTSPRPSGESLRVLPQL